MKKKLLLLILILALLGWGGYIIIKAYLLPAPQVLHVTLAQEEAIPEMAPHWVAGRKGFFKEYLVKVKINTLPAGESAREALAQGMTDVAIMELAEFIYHRAMGADLVAIAALTTREPSYIISQEQTSSFTWNDLKNKTIIGEPPESTAGILLETVLRLNNLAPYRSVNIFYNIPADLQQGAFTAGCSSFLQASAILAARLEMEKQGVIVSSLVQEKIPALLYVTTSKTLGEREKLQRFINGVHKGLLWMKHHPQEIAGTIKKEIDKYDQQLLQKVVSMYVKDQIWPENLVVEEKDLVRFQDMMLAAGELPRPLSGSGVVDNKFARQALETVEYVPPEKQKKGLKIWPFHRSNN